MANRLIINSSFLIICSILLVNFVFGEDVSNLLDGKTFIGFNGEKGKDLDPDEDEELVFQNGRLLSISCNKYNFADAAYSAVAVGDSVHFEAITVSPTHGEIAWKGVVHGDQAEVSFVWTKVRWYWDTHREYWFRGSIKK